MKKIKCPCCEGVSDYDSWYEKSGDDFYICPKCDNTCTHEEIEPQLKRAVKQEENKGGNKNE